MATDWYWLEQNEEKGPVTFRDLALMVQEHVLNEDDLVRPHYARDWEKAYRVVGLFYMAKRVAVPLPEEPAPDPVAPSRIENSPARTERWSTWESAQDSVLEYGSAPEGSSSTEKTGFVSEADSLCGAPSVLGDSEFESGEECGFTAVIGEAAEEWDRRHARPIATEAEPRQPSTLPALVLAPVARIGAILMMLAGGLLEGLLRAGKVIGIGALCRLLDRVASRQVLAWWFRGGCAVASAAAAGWGVRIWSYYETLRYPNPEWIAAGKTAFPFFGACLPVEYTFMLVDVVVASAILGFFAAVCLEKLADD